MCLPAALDASRLQRLRSAEGAKSRAGKLDWRPSQAAGCARRCVYLLALDYCGAIKQAGGRAQLAVVAAGAAVAIRSEEELVGRAIVG